MNSKQLLDFETINRAIISNVSYLQSRLPLSHFEGSRLHAGNLSGGKGRSFNLDLKNNGAWYDHSTGEGGRDAISLVAAQESIGQGEALNLVARDLGLGLGISERKNKELPKCPTIKENIVATYLYYDEYGEELFCSFRYEKAGYRKNYRQGVRTANGVKFCTEGRRKVLYNLYSPLSERPTVQNSSSVVIVEGENKVEALVSMGICATCNVGGAKKWKEEYSKYLKGKSVVILPDNDAPGREHAESIAKSLMNVAASLKIVELPGLPDKGDVLDWLNILGGNKENLEFIISDAPFWKSKAECKLKSRPLDVDWSSYGGAGYLASQPEPFRYLLEGAFLKNELGLISGPPGAGKGTFSLQMAAYIAAGIPIFDWWNVPQPTKVLYISAEDSKPVIHRRLHFSLMGLPESIRYEAARRIVAVPVRGRVNICHEVYGTSLSSTEHLVDLRKIINEFRPGLVFLDTLSRFLGIDENDNPAMTSACGVIEEIMMEYGCNVILLHHVNKATGDCVNKKSELVRALSQTAIRGASALAGAVRFAVVLAPLGEGLATNIIGGNAKGKAVGSYLGVRVAKKNIGAPEPIFYLCRDENGLLQRVREVNRNEDIASDAYKLVEEVRRRIISGEAALSLTKGGRTAFGWGDTQNKKVTMKAIELGLLEPVDKEKGKGKVLSLKG